MRGRGLKLASAEYLVLSAPHGNDGVLLRQRKEIYPEPHVVLLVAALCFTRWNACPMKRKAYFIGAGYIPLGPCSLISDL